MTGWARVNIGGGGLASGINITKSGSVVTKLIRNDACGAYKFNDSTQTWVPTGGVSIISSLIGVASNTPTWTGTTSSSSDDNIGNVAGGSGFTTAIAHATASGSVTESIGTASPSGWVAGVFQP